MREEEEVCYIEVEFSEARKKEIAAMKEADRDVIRKKWPNIAAILEGELDD